MPTFRMTVAYDGTDYVGWQVQPNGPTIQAELQDALEALVGHPVRVTGSGRTDSGVHAAGQVAGFTVPTWRHDADVFVDALNTRLPDSIAVLQCERAADDFHAIADAIEKTYRYHLQSGGVPCPASARNRWRVRGRGLDRNAMASAAIRLVGRHDFASFEAVGAPRQSSVRTVRELRVVPEVDPTCRRDWFRVEVTADGFLYNMVRNLVGTLVEIGRGKHSPDWIDQVLAARDRSAAGPTAPAHGLTLWQVRY